MSRRSRPYFVYLTLYGLWYKNIYYHCWVLLTTDQRCVTSSLDTHSSICSTVSITCITPMPSANTVLRTTGFRFSEGWNCPPLIWNLWRHRHQTSITWIRRFFHLFINQFIKRKYTHVIVQAVRNANCMGVLKGRIPLTWHPDVVISRSLVFILVLTTSCRLTSFFTNASKRSDPVEWLQCDSMIHPWLRCVFQYSSELLNSC